jgi:hypothetical protein
VAQTKTLRPVPPSSMTSQTSPNRLLRLMWAAERIAREMGPECHADVRKLLYEDVVFHPFAKGPTLEPPPSSPRGMQAADKARRWLEEAQTPTAYEEARIKVEALGLDPEAVEHRLPDFLEGAEGGEPVRAVGAPAATLTESDGVPTETATADADDKPTKPRGGKKR